MLRYRAVILALTLASLTLPVALAPPAHAAAIQGGAAKSVVASASRIAEGSGFSGPMLGRADRPSNPTSDHPSGFAIDYMVDSRAEGDRVARYARDNAGALRVKYVLWRVEDHFDHVHVSFRR